MRSEADVRLIGESNAAHALRAEIDCAARTDAKVLITGESGVGKDVAARLIHQRSSRSGRPLVSINCAGVPDSLLESELFGYVRGSFTDAYRDKPGLLELAPNGTVFLDEVGEMSLRMQMVLLRFLETGEIQRIGATRAHTRVNVRLITATNRDLQAHIAAGAFREDLYYRLNVIRLSIAPLRDRRDDIPLLVGHFFDAYSRQHAVARPEISEAAMEILAAHRWPGNIRELKNVVERLTVKANGRPILPTDLPADVFVPSTSSPVAIANSETKSATVDRLAERLFQENQSFWTAVYPLFMSRDMTRDDLRRLVRVGLERTGGNYRALVELFNMRDADYKRFLAFLRKHNCHVPFQQFRAATAQHKYRLHVVEPQPLASAVGQ